LRRSVVTGHLIGVPATEGTEPGSPPGSPALVISDGLVELLRARAGGEPKRATALVFPDQVAVTLRNCLTPAERTLADAGHAAKVIEARRTLYEVIRPEAAAIVESATGRRVVAYLADHHHRPDVGVLVFILDPLAEA
jgi:uncharacterized protein YbcI